MTRKFLIPIAILAVVSVFLFLKYKKDEHLSQQTADDALIQKIVSSEELMDEQRKPLKKLAQILTYAAQPAEHFPEIFATAFKGDVVTKPLSAKPIMTNEISLTQWTVSEKPSAYQRGIGWDPFTAAISDEDDYDFLKLYMIEGDFQDDGTFHAMIGIQGRLLKENVKQWTGFRGKQKVVWEKSADGLWQILSWKITSFETLSTATRLFKEVTQSAIPDVKTRMEALQSMHEEFFVRGLTGKSVTMHSTQAHLVKYLTRDTVARHPGLSVVDYDGDGWDDLYVTVRLGRNILLHNEGDGTFKDTTDSAGLRVLGFSTSALFADFDNDGDPDLFLGRSLLPSQYFENNGGVFTECSNERFNCPLPQSVTSLSAVDYNQDGLLDIYAATYPLFGKTTAETIEKNRPFISPDQLAEFSQNLRTSDRYLNMAGPPNVLYINRGSQGFDRAPEHQSLALFKCTLQAVWSDFDDDGDPDVYIANDFSSDTLMRNDGKDEKGHIRFTDITREIGHVTMAGFGMGVSWGDYDRDGKQDIYVSNMFSKAGMRITAQMPTLDPRFRLSAEGSRLFSFNGKNFELKSQPEPGGMAVNKSGWSWGGQFFDADNDGWLDLYAANGHYTAHPEISNEADG